jgi:hypothetical protein
MKIRAGGTKWYVVYHQRRPWWCNHQICWYYATPVHCHVCRKVTVITGSCVAVVCVFGILNAVRMLIPVYILDTFLFEVFMSAIPAISRETWWLRYGRQTSFACLLRFRILSICDYLLSWFDSNDLDASIVLPLSDSFCNAYLSKVFEYP